MSGNPILSFRIDRQMHEFLETVTRHQGTDASTFARAAVCHAVREALERVCERFDQAAARETIGARGVALLGTPSDEPEPAIHERQHGPRLCECAE